MSQQITGICIKTTHNNSRRLCSHFAMHIEKTFRCDNVV